MAGDAVELADLALGEAVLWKGAQGNLPAVVLKVEGDRVELAYKRGRSLRTGTTRPERIERAEKTAAHERILKAVAPQLQLSLFS